MTSWLKIAEMKGVRVNGDRQLKIGNATSEEFLSRGGEREGERGGARGRGGRERERELRNEVGRRDPKKRRREWGMSGGCVIQDHFHRGGSG